MMVKKQFYFLKTLLSLHLCPKLTPLPPFSSLCSSYCTKNPPSAPPPGEEPNSNSSLSTFNPSTISPCHHIQKLIPCYSYANTLPSYNQIVHRDFHHFSDLPAVHNVAIRLARNRQFSLLNSLLQRLHHHLRSCGSFIPPYFFLDVIQIFGDLAEPDRALVTFLTMPEFGSKPSIEHLNALLQALIENNQLQVAYSVHHNSEHVLKLSPDSKTFKVLIKAFCLARKLSLACALFNESFKRDAVPDEETYRILMQGLCRRSQVNSAANLLDDMVYKGFSPDALTYTSMLNSLCRKKKLREAYKLLCRMKMKGCNPDVVHYNTLIVGFCRERRAKDAQKLLEEMAAEGCLPNIVSYRSLVNGLCREGLVDEAKIWLERMVNLGLDPHFSTLHAVIIGFCGQYRTDEACEVVKLVLTGGWVPHRSSWEVVVPLVCEDGWRGVMEMLLIHVKESWEHSADNEMCSCNRDGSCG